MRDFSTWDFHNPTYIQFGLEFPAGLKDHLENVPTLFVTSPGSTKRGVTAKVETLFKEKGISYQVLDYATANPSFEDLKVIANKLGSFRPGHIIAIGGGSVMDLAKILTYALSSEAPSVEEILNLLVQGKPLPVVTNIPFIAVPTTAGTGSEVTPFATIWDMQNKKKYSIGTKNLHPKKALLFPELTVSLPWDITVSTGLDALSQALESVWNKNYTHLTAAIAESAIHLIFEALPKLKKNPLDMTARAQMLEGSLLSGLCISKTRTAMAHAMSYPLTAHYGTPHGIACSFTLPDLWDYNLVVDDGRMLHLCNVLGFDSNEFSQKLFSFLSELDFKTEFKKTIKTTESVLKLSGEMYAPGRSDNNLRSFDPPSLKTFIETATNRWI
jgi:phosphonate metabolism-associated iron-containing alcohol dehydrogenase